MIEAHDAGAVRAAEEPLLAAGVPLMERASFALATVVLRELRARRGRAAGAEVLLLVGGGNNGGDALYAGALLARRGCGVRAALLAPEEKVHVGGLAAARRAGVRVVPLGGAGKEPGRGGGLGPREVAEQVVAVARRSEVWVDGLTGIGARGGLREPLATVVRALTELAARRTGSHLRQVLGSEATDPLPQIREPASDTGEGRTAPGARPGTRQGPAGGGAPLVVAVDVPSGIGVDDGTLPGPVLPADRTVTMGTAKPGLLLPPAAASAGAVEVVDLGLEPGAPTVRRLEPADAALLWPVPGEEDHKYTRGVLGLAAGSHAYPGAAVLAAAGAARAGLGMIRFLGPETPAALVRAAHPEVVTVPGRVQAWALGSGVPAEDAARLTELAEQLERAAVEGLPVVLDAGALALLHDEGTRLDLPAVLTPHAGELAALLAARGEEVTRAQVLTSPASCARRAAELTGAVVLLKGATSLVAPPAGPLYAQRDATGWLAIAGAGDVLAGVLGALLAGHAGRLAPGEKDRADLLARLAATATLVHGRAARLAVGLPPEADVPRPAGGPGEPLEGPGRPIVAGEVADALPAALHGLLASVRHWPR